MPRARQMPRTRWLRAAQTSTWLLVMFVVTLGGAAVKGAGEDWWLALLAYIPVAAGVVALASWVSDRVDRAVAIAIGRDQADLPIEDRSLPFGVVEGADGTLLLPTKTSTTVLVAVVAAIVILAGAAIVLVDEMAARIVGALIILLGLWLATLCVLIAGTRYRLTREGIESTMRLSPQRYRWLEVPQIDTDRQIVVLRAAGARSPRVWIRVGVLEVSLADCLAMIHRQRGW